MSENKQEPASGESANEKISGYGFELSNVPGERSKKLSEKLNERLRTNAVYGKRPRE